MESAQPQQSYQAAFARHGFVQGYPLWNPEPILLPRGRQKNGLKIGDVGTIDGDGDFYSFFNICKPLDSALKRKHGFPSGFELVRKPDILNHRSFPPRHVFSSPRTSWFHRENQAPHYVDGQTVDDSNVIIQYTANLSEDGAHIIVPQGAICSKLAPQDRSLFQSQANDHWMSWFDFARSRLGHAPRSIYLITELCQTRSWSVASFEKDGKEIQVECELVEREEKIQMNSSHWEPSGRFDCAIGPTFGDQGNINQTVFIRSFTITSNGVVPPLNQAQLAVSTDSGPSTSQNSESTHAEATLGQTHHQAGSLDGHSDSGPSSSVGPVAGTTMANDYNVTIQHTPLGTKLFHPSEIINEYLLTKEPAAKVAVTHDSVWISMLNKGQLSELQDLKSALDSIVSEHHLITLRNGVVYLRNKDESLSRLGINQSNLPIDLTGCIERESKSPWTRSIFGNIYKGLLHTLCGSTIKVAIKVITTGFARHNSPFEQHAHTIELLSTLDHLNILPFIWTSIEPSHLSMVLPLAESGTLTSYLKEVHSKLTDIQVLNLIHDVAAGLDYCKHNCKPVGIIRSSVLPRTVHSELILHGALSGSSILIDTKGTALLSDFGLSTLLDDHGSLMFAQSAEWAFGTARWAAPESFVLQNNKIIGKDIPTKEGDIYSFGSVMLQILSGKIPYHHHDRDEDVISAICRGEHPKQPHDLRVTEDRWTFIQQCWSPCPERPLSKYIVKFARTDLEYAATLDVLDPPNSEQPILDSAKSASQSSTTEMSKLTHVEHQPETNIFGPRFAFSLASRGLTEHRSTSANQASQVDENDHLTAFPPPNIMTLNSETSHRNGGSYAGIMAQTLPVNTDSASSKQQLPLSDPYSIPCRWTSSHGEMCGESITKATVSRHLSSHGIRRLSRNIPVTCKWDDCGRRVNRESLTRHIREVHMGCSRPLKWARQR